MCNVPPKDLPGVCMQAVEFIKNFTGKFIKDETTTLAASLAFYTALSLAPLVILFVTISSQFSPELQRNLVTEIRALVGHDAALAVEMVIDGAKTRPDLTSLASLLGIVTLLLSASLIFGELRSALNRIFEVPPKSTVDESVFAAAWHFVKQRFFQVGLALSFIFVLIVSLIASSVISALSDSYIHSLAWAVNIGISLVGYIGMFTLMYRFLPDRRQPWKRALISGALTAGLFVLGKELIGLYLGNSALGSAYGAAGSIIVLLAWVYYSTMITFIGAQVSAILMPPHQPRTNV